MSPTQRSLKHLRDQGYLADVVEKWIPRANIRKDLYGFIDILCLRDTEILAVQATSASNVAARLKKIRDHENLGAVRKAGISIKIHGWGKNAKGRYVLREVDIS